MNIFSLFAQLSNIFAFTVVYWFDFQHLHLAQVTSLCQTQLQKISVDFQIAKLTAWPVFNNLRCTPGSFLWRVSLSTFLSPSTASREPAWFSLWRSPLQQRSLCCFCMIDYIWIFVKSFLSRLYAILIINILDPWPVQIVLHQDHTGHHYALHNFWSCWIPLIWSVQWF